MWYHIIMLQSSVPCCVSLQVQGRWSTSQAHYATAACFSAACMLHPSLVPLADFVTHAWLPPELLAPSPPQVLPKHCRLSQFRCRCTPTHVHTHANNNCSSNLSPARAMPACPQRVPHIVALKWRSKQNGRSGAATGGCCGGSCS